MADTSTDASIDVATLIELSESRLQHIQSFQEEYPQIALNHYADLTNQLLSGLSLCGKPEN